MQIEVTRKTFEILFEPIHFQKTDRSELAAKCFYWNSDLDQKGIMIHNFNGNVFQYYLIDINA